MWSCLAVLLYITGCAITDKNEKKSEEKFQVINPVILDTVYYKEYVADIHSIKNVEIRSRIQGQLEKIHVDEGQSVKKGQLLFRISDHVYKEDLIKAKAVLKNAIAEAKAGELEVLNVKILLEKNIVSKTEMDLAESKLEALKAKIEEAQSHEASAQLKLSLTQIKAPFDGIIDRIPLKMGSLIEEGTFLTSLSDNSEVYSYFNVSENEYLDFVLNPKASSEKNEVSLLLSNSTEHSHKGEVETIEGEFDKASGNISFRARFPNPKGILKHGSSGRIRLKKEVKNALIIPQKSTFEVQDKMYVYVIGADNVVKSRSIVSNLRIPHLYVIESGLSANDRILYEGIQNVKEDQTIIPELVSMKQIISQLVKQ
jgi:RND family efflux transporter MFP subunit